MSKQRKISYRAEVHGRMGGDYAAELDHMATKCAWCGDSCDEESLINGGERQRKVFDSTGCCCDDCARKYAEEMAR